MLPKWLHSNKAIENVEVKKRTIDIDILTLALENPHGFGWTSINCKASDFAIAIIDRLHEQKQTIHEQAAKIAEQDKVITSLKAEIGGYLRDKEETTA